MIRRYYRPDVYLLLPEALVTISDQIVKDTQL